MRPVKEIPCSLLLLLRLSVNRFHFILRSHALVLSCRCLCLNALASGLALAVYDLRVLLHRPRKLLISQPTFLKFLLHFLNFPKKLGNYSLSFNPLLNESLSLLLRNVKTALQSLYLLLQLLIFNPTNLQGLDQLSDF